MGATRIVIAVLSCLALSGCHATLYGNQSTVGGTTTTTTASHVSGSTQFSGGRASFSSGGHPIPANAPGGTLRVSGSAAGVVVVGVAFMDLFYYMLGPSQPKPLAPDARIADTCSCYKKTSDEKTSDE
jgi:hypothetical protein